MGKSQLLCTFSNTYDYESDLIRIVNSYDILFNKIFILENVDDPDVLYLTYNVNSQIPSQQLPNTVSMHRKKLTNTLYTINALNTLIKEETGGYDNDYEVNWEEYGNTIILTSGDGLRIIPTEVFKIIKV